MIVVRAWLESDGRLRARVTATDLSQQRESVSTAEGLEEILGIVRTHLQGLFGPSPA